MAYFLTCLKGTGHLYCQYFLDFFSIVASENPLSTLHSPSVDLLLGHRLRRWPNIKTTLAQCLVCTGSSYEGQSFHFHGSVTLVFVKFC